MSVHSCPLVPSQLRSKQKVAVLTCIDRQRIGLGGVGLQTWVQRARRPCLLRAQEPYKHLDITKLE
jgi:hypothetical protein